MEEEPKNHEDLVKYLNDPKLRAEYARPYDQYHVRGLPRILGKLFVGTGNSIYGHKPTYQKMKAIEIVARIPYQSWEIACYTILTIFHTDEKWAMRLARTTAFSRTAQDNETMHVVVISHLVRKLGVGSLFHHTLLPILFSYFYFHIVFFLYLIHPRSALELNYIFESHAYEQYSLLLAQQGEKLKARRMESEFLNFYGRVVRTEYEFFESVRNDELIHRNRSIKEIEARQ